MLFWLCGVIVCICWGVVSRFLFDAGLVRPVERGGIRLSLQKNFYVGFLDSHGEVVLEERKGLLVIRSTKFLGRVG